jgi:hypothetical protein
VVDVLGVVVVEVDTAPQRVEQRQHGGVADQRQLVAGDLDRDPGRAEARRSGGMLARPSGPARHLVPRDAVLEVGARSRSARCSASARSVSKVRTTTRPVAGPARGTGAGTPRAPSADGAGQPDPAGDPLGGDEQPRPEPAGRAQRDHVGAGGRRRAGTSAGNSRMPRTSAPRKP